TRWRRPSRWRQAADASWVRAPFLLDTGAQRTVLSAAILRLLALPSGTSADRIGGLGGPSVPGSRGETPPRAAARTCVWTDRRIFAMNAADDEARCDAAQVLGGRSGN